MFDDRFNYEEIMNEREENSIKNRCPILNKEFRDRVCPSDGVSSCKDCPFTEKKTEEVKDNKNNEFYW